MMEEGHCPDKMPWPRLWSSSGKHDDSKVGDGESITDQAKAIASELVTPLAPVNSQNATPSSSPWHSFTQPQTILASVVLTATCLGTYRFYRTYLRRIPEATNIHSSYFRRRSIFGRVTSVGDGDNFRIYHTPGGRLAGWGWVPGRTVPTDKKELRNQTIHVRIAGIDAPEASHFGRPAQPFSADALAWLTNYVSGRRVRAYVYKIDQYSRVVATAYVWRGIFRRDVGLQMLKAGFATIYEAKSGAEFGEGLEKKYRDAEWWAKARRKGMWAGSRKDYESPRDYKNKYGGGTT